MNTQGSTQIMYSEILLGMTTTFFLVIIEEVPEKKIQDVFF